MGNIPNKQKIKPLVLTLTRRQRKYLKIWLKHGGAFPFRFNKRQKKILHQWLVKKSRAGQRIDNIVAKHAGSGRDLTGLLI